MSVLARRRRRGGARRDTRSLDYAIRGRSQAQGLARRLAAQSDADDLAALLSGRAEYLDTLVRLLSPREASAAARCTSTRAAEWKQRVALRTHLC